MNKKQPIGVFDSGLGGLTILKEIIRALPGYDYLYLGDNARTPYGTRSFESVYQFTLECVKKLFDHNCHLIILACNTASAKALRTIQQKDLPKLYPNRRVLGVLRPTTEIIGNFSKTKHLGILGTTGTIMSNSYPIEIEKFFPEVKVYQHACPMWVPLVENNEHSGDGADFFIQKDINILLEKDSRIDTILLACTHYPLMIQKILKSVPENIKVISQDEILAKSLKDYLDRHPEIEQNCSKNGEHEFLTTDSTEVFDSHASIFFGKEVKSKHLPL
ncbi:MAG: glutamate racemase [Bacteroidales bacterium]|nr:glutamate racemase [Bacteroidales bacterium]